MVLIELFFAVLVILIALFAPRLFLKFSCPKSLLSLTRSKRLSILVTIAFPLLVRGLLLPVYGPPPPVVPDDYSYKFLGDTFALGRVANPTPPLPEHFETTFEIVKPTFSSQYQPGQGIVIGLGKAIAGDGWWGIYLSASLFFGVLCWALQGALPPSWAFFATMLCALQFGVFGIFMNSFRGATVAATGGAIVFGCVARIRKEELGRWIYGVLMAIGSILMLAGRPVEGAIWVVVIAVTVLFTKPLSRRLLLIVPFCVTMAAGICVLGWYNVQVTGTPLKLPYVQYQQLYGTQGFWWQAAVQKPAETKLPEFDAEYQLQLKLHDDRKSLRAIISNVSERFSRGWLFFIGPLLTIPFFFFPSVVRSRRSIFWVLVLIPFALDHLTFHTWYPNQSAPEYVLFAFVAVQSWRYMRTTSKKGIRVGRLFSHGLVAAGLSTFCIPIVGKVIEPHLPGRLAKAKAIWYCEFINDDRREPVISFLNRQQVKHLVFVKWSDVSKSDFVEWVNNEPNLSLSNVIWTRSINPESDRKLANTFPGRIAWLLHGASVRATVSLYKP